MDQHPLDRLFSIIALRRSANSDTSYTATLLAKGRVACAKKLGEEAIETVIAAASENNDAVIRESADLLYHLLVVWAVCGIEPSAIYAELRARETQSGLQEKAARGGG
jgi:phosphoribosyl-ATP pyrophosphohydrolase